MPRCTANPRTRSASDHDRLLACALPTESGAGVSEGSDPPPSPFGIYAIGRTESHATKATELVSCPVRQACVSVGWMFVCCVS